MAQQRRPKPLDEERKICEDTLQDIARRLSLVEQRCKDVDEERGILCECLQEAGVMRPGELFYRQRAWRFRRMVQEAFATPELFEKVGQFAGLTTSYRVGMVSRDFRAGILPIRHGLHAMLLPKIYICGGRWGGVCSPTVERYDIITGCWETMPPMPTARYGCDAAVADKCLYVFGGHGGGPMLDTSERFDPSLMRWDELPAMPTARSCCTVTAIRGQLYVVGGFDGRQPLATVERFNPRTCAGTPSSTTSTWPSWELLPDMPTARYGCSSSVLGGMLYIVGGHNGSHALATAERFNPVVDHWLPLAKMPTPRHSCASVVSGGCLNVFGGLDGRQALGSFERFDPLAGRWLVMPSMPSCRYEFAAIQVTGVLYIFGGHDGRQALSSSWRYASGQWTRLQEMTVARGGCACASLGP